MASWLQAVVAEMCSWPMSRSARCRSMRAAAILFGGKPVSGISWVFWQSGHRIAFEEKSLKREGLAVVWCLHMEQPQGREIGWWRILWHMEQLSEPSRMFI